MHAGVSNHSGAVTCPTCGADAYRHKTADAGEFWEMIDEAQRIDRPVGDGDTAPFE